MKQPKPKYHFHNPNPPDKSADASKNFNAGQCCKCEKCREVSTGKIKNED